MAQGKGDDCRRKAQRRQAQRRLYSMGRVWLEREPLGGAGAFPLLEEKGKQLQVQVGRQNWW